MKELDLKKSLAELVREYPELKEILAEIGFQDIMKPAALKLMGRIMTLPRGAVVKGIPMEKIRAALEAKGFVLKGAEQQARQDGWRAACAPVQRRPLQNGQDHQGEDERPR